MDILNGYLGSALESSTFPHWKFRMYIWDELLKVYLPSVEIPNGYLENALESLPSHSVNPELRPEEVLLKFYLPAVEIPNGYMRSALESIPSAMEILHGYLGSALESSTFPHWKFRMDICILVQYESSALNHAATEAVSAYLIVFAYINNSYGIEMRKCIAPLGMESGAIRDEDITASSSFDSGNVGPQNGR
uniref:F5/8 type C domain-containing protein n=1 Tax=Timema shepardi TaxID=629360 RepID=A0A7R9FVW3_TIMSH|nr:unnamed protein product [Timema shepardi]